jgi:hypothetical protein
VERRRKEKNFDQRWGFVDGSASSEQLSLPQSDMRASAARACHLGNVAKETIYASMNGHAHLEFLSQRQGCNLQNLFQQLRELVTTRINVF